MINPSSEQLEIFNWFKSGAGNLVIKARAGTGKTTTLKAAFEHAPEKRMAYFVFNKRNQLEAAEKIKDPRIDIKTLHSLGFGFVKQLWRNAKPDDEVEADRLDYVSRGQLNDFWEARGAILKLVSFAKNTFINPSYEEIKNLADERDIYFNGGFTGDAIQLTLDVLTESKNQDKRNRISFNDMVWLPCALNLVRPIYDLVSVDETQDMSVPQLEMVRLSSRGRVAVVGDDRQCIYSFRGCHADGMGMMKEVLNATELKLTTSYRCSRAVIKHAQLIVPDINAADNAIEGEVTSVKNCDNAQPGDFILSRLNAPLMPLALNLLRQKIPARIEGRDIGKQLLTMIKSQKAKSVPHFFEKINGWFDKQVARIGKGKNSEKKLETSKDILDTLSALAENCANVAEIEQRIYSLFQDTDKNSRPAVILSTIHRAKGMEAERVFMLMHTFNNRKGNEVEESNIKYVAITRSRNQLFLVNGS
jgi:superfamily I DNA/RNA helicase